MFFFFLVKRAGRHFGFFKRARRHEKGAGRRALQKKPRQNTAYVMYSTITVTSMRQPCNISIWTIVLINKDD